MTTSSDRLDRIEVLVEKNSQAIEKNSEAIEKNSEAIRSLTQDLSRFDERLDSYERGMRWVVQLAFGLLISATVALIVSALTFLIRTSELAN